ncbi:MAG TPA: TIR domain-containing protein, partial [Stellaceae bacterium]
TPSPAARAATAAPASPAREAPGAPSILRPVVAAAEPAPATAEPAPPPAAAEAAAPGTRDVIVVHGNDTVASGEIARFLRKAEFNAIILHQQGDEARTDIERLERHSGAGFAVVLLPPEEESAPKPGFRRPRARQAVTAELFYFVGKLGRARVCALTTNENEEPAVTGLSYAHYDPYEGWQKVLLKALEDAGYKLDWAKALR